MTALLLSGTEPQELAQGLDSHTGRGARAFETARLFGGIWVLGALRLVLKQVSDVKAGEGRVFFFFTGFFPPLFFSRFIFLGVLLGARKWIMTKAGHFDLSSSLQCAPRLMPSTLLAPRWR